MNIVSAQLNQRLPAAIQLQTVQTSGVYQDGLAFQVAQLIEGSSYLGTQGAPTDLQDHERRILAIGDSIERLIRLVPVNARLTRTVRTGEYRSDNMDESSAKLASWIFGGILLLFMMAVVWYNLTHEAASSISPGTHRIIGFLCAILAGLFGYFFSGVVAANVSLRRGSGVQGYKRRVALRFS